MQNLDLAIILSLIDRASAPARRLTDVVGRMQDRVRAGQQAIRGLNQEARGLDRLAHMERQIGTFGNRLGTASQRAASLQAQLVAAQAAGRETARIQQRLASAQARVQTLTDAQTAVQRRLAEGMRTAGIHSGSLSEAQARLGQRTAAATEHLQRQTQMLSLARRGVSGMHQAFERMRGLALTVGLPVAAVGGLLAGSAVGVAKEFEKYETILYTLEGNSEEKAAQSLAWVSKFAAETPYEVGEVTAAFVKLKAYGLDPTNGLLRTLGDTGAAMGKPVMQAVEAIADAVTGENERLKEFGIKARKGLRGDEKGFTFYEYTDKEGKQQELKVKGDDRKAIQDNLSKIWNEKFGGAMDRLSKGYTGITSNISDQWTRFQKMVMDSGPFDRMKKNAQSTLDKINKMAESGELQAYADRIGQAVADIFDWLGEAKDKLMSLWMAISPVTGAIARFVGGWGNLIAVLVAAKFLPVIAAIKLIGSALASLATLAMAHPMIALAAGLAAAAVLIIANWEQVSVALEPVFRWIGEAGSRIGTAWQSLVGQASVALQPLFQFLDSAAAQAQAAWVGFIGQVSVALEPIFSILESAAVRFQAGWEAVATYMAALPARFMEFGQAIVAGLGAGIDAAWGAVKAKVQGMIDWLPGVVKEQLGIESPSTVFAEIGGHLMAGLSQGLAGGENGVLNRVSGMGEKLKAAGAGLLLAGGSQLAMAGVEGLPAGMAGGLSQLMDNPVQVEALAPLRPAGQSTGQAPAGALGQSAESASLAGLVINVYAAPGMDARQVADLVSQRLQQAQRDAKARMRSRIYDDS